MKSALIPMIALLVTSCATMTKEDVKIVNRAKTIHRYPVSRDKFIKTLGLGGMSSERKSGGARGGWCSHWETWTFPSGKLVHAWDFEYEGNLEIKRSNFDVISNNSVDGIPLVPPPPPPRKSFKSCMIASPRGKIFFNSSSYIHSLGKSS